MNGSELDRIEAAIKALRAIGGEPRASLANESISLPAVGMSEETMVLSCICDVLSSMNVEHFGIEVLRKRTGAAFREKLPGLMRYLKRAHPKRSGQRALLHEGIGLLYQELTASRLPTTASTMANHIHRVPAVIERHYPGYARGGLLRWIVDSRRKRHA